MNSSVTNSVIHNGFAWGVYIYKSANINITNNIVFNFRPIGLGVISSHNITIDNNIVGGIVGRTTFEGDAISDKEGGISICAYTLNDKCQNLFVRNNTVAGA